MRTAAKGKLASYIHGGARIGGADAPLTPEIAAEVEARYYAAIATGGELTQMRALLRASR